MEEGLKKEVDTLARLSIVGSHKLDKTEARLVNADIQTTQGLNRLPSLPTASQKRASVEAQNRVVKGTCLG